MILKLVNLLLKFFVLTVELLFLLLPLNLGIPIARFSRLSYLCFDFFYLAFTSIRAIVIR